MKITDIIDKCIHLYIINNVNEMEATMTNFNSSFWHKKIENHEFSQEDFPADFHDGIISGINFHGLDLEGCDFSHATVRDCNFEGCNLTGVNFFGADIHNCSFIGAKISTHSIITWRTRFPEALSVVDNAFDDKGIEALKELIKLSADAEKRARDWMDRHPIRQRWQPGGKLDSPWN